MLLFISLASLSHYYRLSKLDFIKHPYIRSVVRVYEFRTTKAIIMEVLFL